MIDEVTAAAIGAHVCAADEATDGINKTLVSGSLDESMRFRGQ